MRKVEVHKYNPEWQAMFEDEANKLREILGDELVTIHHIGSTSVPGLRAKPIIDILPVVKDIMKVDDFNQALKKVGYSPRGENGITGRRYFEKGGDNRTHHIHFYQAQNDEIDRHLAFRDYLKSHPDKVKEYGELKNNLAQNYPYNIESYINGKADLVSQIEKLALEWHNHKG